MGEVAGYKEAENYISEAFHEHVPDVGKSENQYAEITRAIMKLMYRNWNDGCSYASSVSNGADPGVWKQDPEYGKSRGVGLLWGTASGIRAGMQGGSGL